MTLYRTSLATLALLVMLTMAAHAHASYDPIGAGSTKITFDNTFFAALKQQGVKLIATGPVRVRGKAVTFPVSGGKLDPVAVKGTVEHEGALVFQAGAKSLPLKSLTLKTTQVRSPFSAKFGGGQLKLSESAKLSTKRSGFGLAAKVSKMTLSAKVATRLDKKLGLRGVFAAGQPLGTALTNAQPETVAIKQAGLAGLAIAPEFAAKLASLFVALNPIFPAEHLGAPFTLPIAGGQIAPDASSGTLQTTGTLEAIQQGGGQVFIRELWPELGGARAASVEFDLEPSPPFAGKLGRTPILDLGAGAPSANPSARTITVAGAIATLQAASAQAFNEAFAKPQGKSNIFKAGDPLGTLSFVAQGQ